MKDGIKQKRKGTRIISWNETYHTELKFIFSHEKSRDTSNWNSKSLAKPAVRYAFTSPTGVVGHPANCQQFQ
ncbi:MAG: hypothetical protein EOO01_31250 [Chitinophagaceae bacterium]|nr:MAG: hypothetical protein EOO01_31250 [Chitinophagaceae bacterium]